MHRLKKCGKRIAAAILSAMMMAGSLSGTITTGTMVYAAEAVPKSYSSVDEGYTPAVRNQGNFGNCWTYAAAACVEISMIKNNVASKEDVDLSEAHMIYYICRPVADPLGGTDVDYTSVMNDTVYDMFQNGGEIGYTAANLLGWMGPVQEEDFYSYEYLYENHNLPTQLEGLNDLEHAYGNRAATVVESVAIPVSNSAETKKAIMEYGAVGVSYNSDGANFNSKYSAQYAKNGKAANHAVVIVGWDDDFSKDKFKETPEGDGAWLVRNSWGPSHGENGYFWLSYYDATLSSGGRAYKAVAADKYDNNYRYDRTGNDVGYVNGVEEGSIEAANLFKIQGEQEILKAVQIGIQWKNLNYSIQVYKNPTDAKDPTTGTALLDAPVKGTKALGGNYTIDLGQKILLEKDDVIAVSVTYTSDNPLVCPAAQSGNTGVCRVGESVYRVNGGEWKDCGEQNGNNFIIRAFTSNVTEAEEGHTHDWSDEWSSNDYAHWHDCDGNTACTEESGSDYGAHTGGTANCRDKAICDTCGVAYGLKNADDHVGGMVRKNYQAPTTTLKGYTGDVCCGGCGIILEEGQEIPVLTGEDSGMKSVANLDYTFNSIDEQPVSTAVNGKPKMIIFFGAECGGCINTLNSFTKQKVDGVDVVAVEVKNSAKQKVVTLKDTLGVGAENIEFCYDEGTDNSIARVAYEKAYNGMTYSSLPVICYIDEYNQINHMTSGAQTLTDIKTNLARFCKIKTTNLNIDNTIDDTFKTFDGEEVTMQADGQPKVLVFFDPAEYSRNTLLSISSKNLQGVDIYALNIWNQDEEITKTFVNGYMHAGSNIKVIPDASSMSTMFAYLDLAKNTDNIVYPVVCYIDADNKLQQLTMGETTFDELKRNLVANCGYQEVTVTPNPTETEAPVPSPTETEVPTVEPTEEPTPNPTETEVPTPEVTEVPTVEPTKEVTPEPTETEAPTVEPTEEVTPEPTETEAPTVEPTEEVTPEPTETEVPTVEPTEEVTPEPTETEAPTVEPTEEVTPEPTETEAPTVEPTEEPTPEVTEVPTTEPTEEPTETPDETKEVTDVFTDVYTDWYTTYVQYVYDNGLMTGIKGTTEFAPNANITKAQVAQVLYNMEGQPVVTDAKVFTELTDVYEAEWYGAAVAWAYETGVVTGDTNAKKFFPNADVTREQLALMIYRYASYKKYDVSATSDFAGLTNAEKVNNWAADGVKWAVGAGLISGIEQNGVKDLAPQGNASRAQVAAILQRFCENVK